jgi:transcriptional regulator with GAF, ATPase, and Fis domain
MEEATEIRRLRACVDDVNSVLALPAGTGQDWRHFVGTLLDAIVGMLRLEFAYARLHVEDGAHVELVRVARSGHPAADARQIGRVLEPWLEADVHRWPARVSSPIGEGEVSIVPLRLGLRNELGVIAAGAARADFPGDTESLLLRVAANQAAIGLQEARFLSEQKRIARELDGTAAERAHQLAAANEELRRIRKQAEDRTRNENLALREEIDRSSMFEEIVGASEGLRRVLARMTKVAPTDSTVLIVGETGTGKELFARAIHKRSTRAGRAFIRVNCAAIPPSLVASELFGHEKGAFTGAVQRRVGRFEAADGGTIFLDEIGDLQAETQGVLLRVLQEREFERVGSSRPVKVDVRVLAATHCDLRAAVKAGSFREDLFYRLSVFPLEIPPLREREDDLLLLVHYLIARFASNASKRITRIDPDTLEMFRAYAWPGNVRELQNVIERAVILSEGETFMVDDPWVRGEATQDTPPAVSLPGTLAENERELIETALAASRGRVSGRSGAAARLGLPRQTLDSKIRALHIDKHRFRTS